ncbi:GNAT family N-acetyltransferase [Periweissella fabalis]|uniref:N-acetyltransferase n=1 Tax=Periweissella fabalis TaxID=1070421 RepID=A0A7X6N531_9LACO|nr:GNAT family N-acetyltransferase [Periweissella fabalis]MCM0598258.1 N-acetyltransferase [Periweissella fabalis]NKZ24807.1 N-acetyltransferase [Periweissella fabalis]
MEFIREPERLYQVAPDGQLLAEIKFPKIPNHNVIVITHTFVDPSLRGQGIANQLLNEVITFAQHNNLKIKPECSFAKKVFAVTPAYQSLQYTE